MTFVPANEGIAKLKPYQPGKPISELERELGITDIVKLASNENPLGCSDKVKEAVAAELAEIGRYPDGGGFILKDQVQAQFSVAHDRITLGNGSNDLLEMFDIVIIFYRLALNNDISCVFTPLQATNCRKYSQCCIIDKIKRPLSYLK